jgi:nucleoside-diphosphate-sugar epimerase
MEQNKNILLVGSSGFLGRNFLDVCRSAGIGLSIVNRSMQESFSEQQFLLHDLEHIPDVFDTVVNLSAHIPYGEMDLVSPELFEVNTILAYRLVRQFPSAHHVYSSSVSVYASNCQQPVDEFAPTQTLNAYGASKLAGECFVRSVLKQTILRFSSLYGCGMSPSTFLPKLVNTALRGEPITLFGDGQRAQDYLHVRDAARMILASIQTPEYGIYNAVNGQSVSNLQLAELVAGLVPDTKILFNGSDLSPSMSYSNRKFQSTYGLTPAVTLKEGVEEMVHGC